MNPSNTDNKTPEMQLVLHIKDVFSYLQLEEHFSDEDKIILQKKLGFSFWQTAHSYAELQIAVNEAKEKMTAGQNQRVLSLMDGLIMLIEELKPTFALLSVSKDGNKDILMPDGEVLLKRLQHHYLMEMYIRDRSESPLPKKNILLPATRRKDAENFENMWHQNLKSAVISVCKSLELTPKLAQTLLDNCVDSTDAYNALEDTKKIVAKGVEDAINAVKKDLDKQSNRLAQIFSEDTLKYSSSKLIPSKTDIEHRLLGRLAQQEDWFSRTPLPDDDDKNPPPEDNADERGNFKPFVDHIEKSKK